MLNTFNLSDHIGVECSESNNSSTVFGGSWTDCIATLEEPVALTGLLLEPITGLAEEGSPIGSVSVVVFPPL